MNTQDNRALGALICGIASIITGWIFVGIVLGAVAIVLAIQSKKISGDSSMATAGLLCGIVGIVYGIPSAICHCMCTCAACAFACAF